MSGAKGPAVFLDRDGVLNRAFVRNGKPYPPAGLDKLEILPGVPAALAALRRAGFSLFGVTNQPDVARGTQRRELVERLNAELLTRLPLDEIVTCYHDEPDACDCRKPRPGLIMEIAARCVVDLSRSFMVGDRSTDIEAGHRAGCTTLFIDYGYAETRHAIQPHWIGGSLQDAATWILSHASKHGGGVWNT